ELRSSNSQNRFIGVLLLFVITILCSYPICTVAQTRTFSYHEKFGYGPESQPLIWKQSVYEDGMIVLRVVRRNHASTGGICFLEMLSLRIIHPNGTVDELDINLEIQSFNYCKRGNAEYLDFHLIINDQILVTYHNATDPNDENTYEEWGMIIDFDGNVKSKISLGFKFVEENVKYNFKALSELKPSREILLNNKRNGFLRIAVIKGSRNTGWKQFKVGLNGIITGLTDGIIESENFSNLLYDIITTYEGYAIVYANTTAATVPLSPRLELFVIFISDHKMAHASLLLYQNQLPNLSLGSLFCDIYYIRTGYQCILTINQQDPSGSNLENLFDVKINFLSSGSIPSLTTIKRSSEINATQNWDVMFLPFGGYILKNANERSDDIIYHILDENGTKNSTFMESKSANESPSAIILLNNTLLIPKTESNNTWALTCIDLPKLSAGKDNGYYNVNVRSTFPEINASVNSDIPNVVIDFYDPVELSDGSLLIYQLSNEEKILRQITLGRNCSLTDDKSVIVEIFNTTFDEGIYFIEMDTNFVISYAYKEPLLGINENVWHFNVEKIKKEYDITTSTTGLLRLTTRGTKRFTNLSESEREQFLNNLLVELADTCLISQDRLKIDKVAQVVTNEQQIISIRIEENKEKDEKDVVSIINDLNFTITHKFRTHIGQGQFTKSIEQNYGDLWQEYKWKFIAMILAIILLLVLSTLAYIKEKKGNKFAIFQLGLFILDLVMDVLFVTYNADNFPEFKTPRQRARKTLTYEDDIIPMLTLTSTTLNLTINVVGRLYKITISMLHTNQILPIRNINNNRNLEMVQGDNDT
ncbi:1269_t:CDS:2, partial [Funneliformis caledonium]